MEIKRIDLTRDYEAHRQEYLEAIERVCRETAFSGGKYADSCRARRSCYNALRRTSRYPSGDSEA